jgi:hypothetical protein
MRSEVFNCLLLICPTLKKKKNKINMSIDNARLLGPCPQGTCSSGAAMSSQAANDSETIIHLCATKHQNSHMPLPNFASASLYGSSVYGYIHNFALDALVLLIYQPWPTPIPLTPKIAFAQKILPIVIQYNSTKGHNYLDGE